MSESVRSGVTDFMRLSGWGDRVTESVRVD